MIEIRNLRFSYHKSGSVILENVSFSIEPGTCLAILGINGAGKSTLLKCINRIHTATAGSILLNGKNIYKMSRREMARQIAYVPQVSSTSHTMVFDYVLLGRKPHIQWNITTEDKKIASDILQQLDLTKFASRYINELSGGELQRVVLARAMAQQPKYLLLDEPTGNLDPRNQHEMMSIVRIITSEQNIGTAIVIHDLNLAIRYCDRFLLLKDTQVHSFGGLEIITSELIREIYGIETDIIEHKGRKIIVPL
ncbi:MAG TPA: iron ABC transporter ATP-binding protein [Firmicutes bacterium]|jgi:iron complex transport system ATP-binding protein|nr:ABC transporter ATP-binding protein [Bacillota bacterium]HAA38150.1 iron ABC transporter ATP-binding protein [Bacillota bacterium]